MEFLLRGYKQFFGRLDRFRAMKMIILRTFEMNENTMWRAV